MASSSSSSSTSSGGATTLGQMCNGQSTVLTGTVYAPNKVDPIPKVRVYAAKSINPYPTNYCDKCAAPIDPAYASTNSAADGTFTLNLDALPAGTTSVDFAIQIGRFRKHTMLPITACTTAAVTPIDAETLPGNSAAGDIPKILVSAGNVDHLDGVLTNLGITEYVCVEGRKGAPNSASATCPLTSTSPFISDVIQSGGINGYHMAFLSCAPGAYAWAIGTHGGNQATMTSNTQTWVANGGRMFVTDTAYDYIAQAFPTDITWAGPAGSPQPVDGANIGCAPGTSPHTVQYPTTINDPTLAAWLALPAIGFSSSPNVTTLGFYQPWSAIQSLAPTSDLIATGNSMPMDATYATTMCQNPTMQVNVPLTAGFDVPTCGRVLFSSYHTYSGNNATSANEKIMEYLIFAAAVCHG